jgi:hypothetical protein
MNEAIIGLPVPLKTLSVTEAPCRELCNFLVYLRNPEILNERARRQPALYFSKFSQTVREIGDMLGAERCKKNRKLYFDCAESRNHRGVLIHNYNAQFWVHYFRCGIGLVSLSYFSQLALAEGSVLPEMSRTVSDSYEFQWFTHDLAGKYFQKEKPAIYIRKLSDYFIRRINPSLVSSYSIQFEKKRTEESYKFVEGSFDDLKEILKWAYFVCEEIKRERSENGKVWISPHLTITCGNLKQLPSVEHSTEAFLNQIGALAIKENVPYSVITGNHFRRLESGSSGWIRKNKCCLYLNLQEEVRMAIPREKISARFRLVNWLRKQERDGERIIEAWRL